MRNWKILDRGSVPEKPTAIIEFDCPDCERGSMLPVLGQPIAQLANGAIVFDRGPQGMPTRIGCPHCRHQFTMAEQS
jgi:hypothetical protein